MVKCCEICKRFVTNKTEDSIGECEFTNEIPSNLKEELARYCDFFEINNKKLNKYT